MIKTDTREDYQERIQRVLRLMDKMESFGYHSHIECTVIRWALQHSQEEIEEIRSEMETVKPCPEWTVCTQLMEDPDEDND